MKTKHYQPVLKTEDEKKTVAEFLMGTLTTREAGKRLNLSHQGIIHLVCALARKWYQDKNIKEIY